MSSTAWLIQAETADYSGDFMGYGGIATYGLSGPSRG
jgi:hypothetical protein